VIGIGIIGAGRVSGAHARAVEALDELRLAGIAEVDAARRERAAGLYRCPIHGDVGALLEDRGVDGVVVALPHWLHCDVTVAALTAGKHVLVEKPMAMTVDECDEMIAAGRAAGRVLMVGHHHHFVPVNVEARRLIGDGEIGNIALATDTWYKAFYSDERPAWFLDATTGGGMWPMNGAHMLDRLSFFLESRIRSVRARVGNPIYGLPATDTGLAFLEFETGVCATIMHAGFRDGVDRFEAEITGAEGQLRVSGRSLWRSRAGQWQEIAVPAPEAVPGGSSPAFVAEMRAFTAAIRDGSEAPVSGEYGREIVRALVACEESSAARREVRLS
jgi:predicted dehydrogenase